MPINLNNNRQIWKSWLINDNSFRSRWTIIIVVIICLWMNFMYLIDSRDNLKSSALCCRCACVWNICSKNASTSRSTWSEYLTTVGNTTIVSDLHFYRIGLASFFTIFSTFQFSSVKEWQFFFLQKTNTSFRSHKKTELSAFFNSKYQTLTWLSLNKPLLWEYSAKLSRN